MRRRDKTGGKEEKTQRRKTLKRRNVPKVARRREPFAVDATERFALLTRERDEVLQQQTATADVLKVISRSTFDLPKVLNTLVESAARLCEADKARILRPTGKDASYYVAASYRHTAEDDEHLRTVTFAPGRGGVVGRVLLEGKSVQIPDVLADQEYTYRETARLGEYRTILGVPLLREGSPIGLLVLERVTVRPFTDKQIELVETFAAQAVIAIENARLLNELRHRTDDLSESLQQQTATADVLKVISSSPGQLEPVFNAMLANATRICEATFGNLFLREGPIFRSVAVHSKEGYVNSWRRNPVVDLRDNPGIPLDRLAKTKQVVHIPDLRTDQSYIGKNDRMVRLVEVAGARTYVTVPMLKEDELIGTISIFREEMRPFSDKQIELVRNFAAQAVIAIENTRLLNELRQSLEQQTATSEVLRVISNSATDLRPVFETIAHNSVNLCGATYGVVFRFDGEMINFVAHHNLDQAAVDATHQMFPMRPNTRSLVGCTILERDVLHVADVAAEPNYTYAATHQALGIRTFLGVPMLRDGNPIGAIALYRREVRLFSNRQIELVKAFADQAVIAIENARLLSDLNKLNHSLNSVSRTKSAKLNA